MSHHRGQPISLQGKVQEIAPSTDFHAYDDLIHWVGPHIGNVTVRTLCEDESVLGFFNNGGKEPAQIYVRPESLGRSGGEMYSLAFFQGPLLPLHYE